MSIAERRRTRATWIGVAVAVAMVLAVTATYTPLFAASDIRILSSPMSRRAVLRLAGVGGATNVFHLDTAEVERRLEADPRVLAAAVRTSLPSHVTISITARRPVAISGAPAVLIGGDGTVIGPTGSRPRELPILRGEDLITAAAAAAAMSPSLRRMVEVIAIRPDGGISVRLEAGFSADLGAPTELPAKAASLAALLRWASAQDARVLSADVTVAGTPTARLADGHTAVPSG